MCDLSEPSCFLDPIIDNVVSKPAQDLAQSVAADTLNTLAGQVVAASTFVLRELTQVWVRFPAPTLTGSGYQSNAYTGADIPAPAPEKNAAGEVIANSGVVGLDKVLGYALYISLGICVLSLIWLGVRMATGKSGQAQENSQRLGIILFSTMLISGSVSIASALVTQKTVVGDSPVLFLQNSLWFYTIAIATFSIIVAGAKMAWEQRAEPGRDVFGSLLTLVVISAVGLTAIDLLIAAADSFSTWIIGTSFNCQLGAGYESCFAASMTEIIPTEKGLAIAGFDAILVLIIFFPLIFANLTQIIFLIVRSGMLIILAGLLPLTAAASSTKMGQTMFRKNIGWIIAFILYKPAAAIVYATAFKIINSELYKADSGLVPLLTGLALMFLSVFTLPALVKLVIPAAAQIAGGGGNSNNDSGANSSSTNISMPSGAVNTGRSLPNAGSAPASESSSGPSGAGPASSGSLARPSGPSGATGSSGATGANGATGAASAAGSTGAAAGTAGASAGTAGAGAAAGSSGALAAAGPVGAAVGAAVLVKSGADKARQVGVDAVNNSLD
jgi:hypothetical protein